MIIRAWTEEGSAKPLRVQIRLTGDVSAGFERSLTFAGPEEVCTAVDAWLRDVLTDETADGDAPVTPLRA